jgi:hypothetical protein
VCIGIFKYVFDDRSSILHVLLGFSVYVIHFTYLLLALLFTILFIAYQILETVLIEEDVRYTIGDLIEFLIGVGIAKLIFLFF